MPKMKTRKSVAKRFKKTAKGRFKRKQAGNDHLRTKKRPDRRRRLRRGKLVSKTDEKRLRKLL